MQHPQQYRGRGWLLLGLLAWTAHGGTDSTSRKKNDDREVIYTPIGKRDPFRMQLNNVSLREINAIRPLEKFSVDQFQLRAVMRAPGKIQAMFEDPEGNTHILVEGQTLGKENAIVSQILQTEVILTLKTINYNGVETLYEKVVSLPDK